MAEVRRLGSVLEDWLRRLFRITEREPPASLPDLLDAVVDEEDEASVPLRAALALSAFAGAGDADRRAFFAALLALGPDRDALRRAAIDFARDPSDAGLLRLQGLADSPRQDWSCP